MIDGEASMADVETPALVLGADPVIEAYKKDIDRTLIRENLRLTVTERILQLQNFVEFALALREAGRKQLR
jgi:hypothetical protein